MVTESRELWQLLGQKPEKEGKPPGSSPQREGDTNSGISTGRALSGFLQCQGSERRRRRCPWAEGQLEGGDGTGGLRPRVPRASVLGHQDRQA